MIRLLRAVRNRGIVLRVAMVALGFVVAAELAASVGIPIAYLTGLLVVPAMVYGAPVVLGGTLGVLLDGVLAGAVSGWTLFTAAETFVFGYGAYALWGRLGVAPDGAQPTMRDARQVVAYLCSVAVAAVCTLAVLAWLAVALGVQPYLTRYGTFLTGAALALVVGPPALYARARLRGASRSSLGAGADRSPNGDPRSALALVAVGVGWYGLSTGLGVLTHDIRVLGAPAAVRSYARRLLGTGAAGDAAGQTLLVLYHFGDVLVLGIGVVAIVALVAVRPRSAR